MRLDPVEGGIGVGPEIDESEGPGPGPDPDRGTEDKIEAIPGIIVETEDEAGLTRKHNRSLDQAEK